MGYQTGILEALRDWDLTVVQVPGWQTRGSSSFDPHGFVAHHDVIGPQTSCPRIIIDGRSDLPGPLSQFWLERNGRVHLVAAGRANHAGEGSWNGLSGNSSVWGCEANNLGTSADPWPQAQLEAYYRLAAACADFSGFSSANVCGHKEWAPTRKVDPHSINMRDFRRHVSEQRKDGLSVADIEAITNRLNAIRTTQLSQGEIIRAIRGAQKGVNKTELDQIDRDLAKIKTELGV